MLPLAACSVPVTQPVTPATAPVVRPAQNGMGSWYGPGFHGKVTAGGTVFDQHALTAAHRTLPLGTRVLVTNTKNGKSVEVTITDRGPYAKDRIIDLSYAAAQTLGMLGSGAVPVRIEILDEPYVIEKIRAPASAR